MKLIKLPNVILELGYVDLELGYLDKGEEWYIVDLNDNYYSLYRKRNKSLMLYSTRQLKTNLIDDLRRFLTISHTPLVILLYGVKNGL